MEALAILAAVYILSRSPPTPATNYSDCKSVVLKLQKLASLSSSLKTTSSDASLLSACVSFLSRQSTGLCWIKGHPKMFVPDESLRSREMWGNHLVDRAAAGSITTTSGCCYKNNYENHVYIHPVPSQDAPSLTSSLIHDNASFFGTSDAAQITFPDKFHITSSSKSVPTCSGPKQSVTSTPSQVAQQLHFIGCTTLGLPEKLSFFGFSLSYSMGQALVPSEPGESYRRSYTK